jgi:hypothetical protein
MFPNLRKLHRRFSASKQKIVVCKANSASTKRPVSLRRPWRSTSSQRTSRRNAGTNTLSIRVRCSHRTNCFTSQKSIISEIKSLKLEAKPAQSNLTTRERLRHTASLARGRGLIWITCLNTWARWTPSNKTKNYYWTMKLFKISWNSTRMN